MSSSARGRAALAALRPDASSSGSSTFSRTDRHSSSTGFWNIIPISGGGPATRRPWTSTVPDVGLSRPASRLRNVDLPHPDGPTNATNSPGRTSSDSPSRATTSPPPSAANVLPTAAARAASPVLAAAGPDATAEPSPSDARASRPGSESIGVELVVGGDEVVVEHGRVGALGRGPLVLEVVDEEVDPLGHRVAPAAAGALGQLEEGLGLVEEGEGEVAVLDLLRVLLGGDLEDLRVVVEAPHRGLGRRPADALDQLRVLLDELVGHHDQRVEEVLGARQLDGVDVELAQPHRGDVGERRRVGGDVFPLEGRNGLAALAHGEQRVVGVLLEALGGEQRREPGGLAAVDGTHADGLALELLDGVDRRAVGRHQGEHVRLVEGVDRLDRRVLVAERLEERARAAEAHFGVAVEYLGQRGAGPVGDLGGHRDALVGVVAQLLADEEGVEVDAAREGQHGRHLRDLAARVLTALGLVGRIVVVAAAGGGHEGQRHQGRQHRSAASNPHYASPFWMAAPQWAGLLQLRCTNSSMWPKTADFSSFTLKSFGSVVACQPLTVTFMFHKALPQGELHGEP